MKLRLLFATILFSTINVFSQTNFVHGYLIKTNGTKVDCLIKNEDWKGSPATFIYKMDENGETNIGSLDNVMEFGADQSFKYVKATVTIDQSSDVVDNLTYERKPEMKEETIFLKTLVDGKASLYYTLKNNTPRYFYSKDGGEIEQLIFKRYLVTRTKMGNNERYKQQLATDLVCDELKEKTYADLQYKTNALVNFFIKYNDCENSESVVFNKNANKAQFNLSLRPGVTFSSFSLQRRGDAKVEFDGNTGIRIGLEAEYVAPFNNGKWSVFIEPTYRNYKAEEEVIYVDMMTFQRSTLVTANYNSIEMPLGVRHYMFLNKDAAFFVDVAILMDASILDSKITSSEEMSYELEVDADAALAFGVGFRYNNKYTIQARYHSSRQLTNYENISSAYNSFSIVAGYNFL